MPRIPYADLDTLNDDAKKWLGARRSPAGNVFRMMANAGAATEGYLHFGAQLRQNLSIDLMLYEMIIVRVGNLSGAGYVIRQHEAFMRRQKVSDDVILALRTRIDSPALSAKEQAALQLVDEVVLDVRASDETFAAAAAHFNPEQLMHIVLAAGQYMLTCRVVETFDVELQPVAES